MLTLITQLNWVAILAAGFAALVVGMLWFLPPTFGLRWAGFVKQYTKLSDADLAPTNLPKTMGLWLLGFIANAFALAVILRGMGISNLGDGLLLAVMVGVGMGLVLSSWPVIHAKQPVGLWIINGAAFLVMQVVMVVALTLLK